MLKGTTLPLNSKISPGIYYNHHRKCELSCCFSGSTYTQNQGEGTSQFSGGSEDAQGVGMVPSGPSAPPVPPSVSPVPMSLPTGPVVPQNTSGQQPSHGFSLQPPVSSGRAPSFHGNQPNISPHMNMQRPTFPPGPELEMLQSLFSCQSLDQNPVDFLNSLLRTQTAGQQGVFEFIHHIIVFSPLFF